MNRATAERIAGELMSEHGLHDWRLSFNRAKRVAGSCNYQTKTITLSLFIMAQSSDDSVRNTLTHEIAHAITKGHGHDRIWQLTHRALGGDGRRCTESEIVDHAAPWIAVCSAGRQHHRYRAPRPGARFRCRCAGYPSAPWSFQPNPARSVNA